jgi:hypothetical protein
MHSTRHPMLFVLAALVGCGGGSSAGHHDAGPGSDSGFADASEAGATDAPDDVGVAQDAGADSATGDTGTTGDSGAICAPLGASCATSANCFCGLAAGCTDDNVSCSDAGVCVVDSLPLLDGGETGVELCCATCQYAYDMGGTMGAWLSCNDACGAGACPVTCLAELTPSP